MFLNAPQRQLIVESHSQDAKQTHVGLVKFRGFGIQVFSSVSGEAGEQREKKERMTEKKQNTEYKKGCKEKIDDDTRHLKGKERNVG